MLSVDQEYKGNLFQLANAKAYKPSMKGELIGSGLKLPISAKVDITPSGTNYWIIQVGDIDEGFNSGTMVKNEAKTKESPADMPDYLGSISTGIGDKKMRIAGWRVRDVATKAIFIALSIVPLNLLGQYNDVKPELN